MNQNVKNNNPSFNGGLLFTYLSLFLGQSSKLHYLIMEYLFYKNLILIHHGEPYHK